MSEVKCDHPGCNKSITMDGTGYSFKKVVADKGGERKAIFFCSDEHFRLDTRPDLNAPVPAGSI